MNRLIRNNEQRLNEFAVSPELLAKVEQQKAALEAKAREKDAKIRAKQAEFRAKQDERRAKDEERRLKKEKAAKEKAEQKAAKKRETAERRAAERQARKENIPVRDISKEITNQDVREISAQYTIMKDMIATGKVKERAPLQGTILYELIIQL